MKYPEKLIAFCLAFTSCVFASEYRFVTIDVPNAVATTAGSINARGDISGRYDD